VAAPKKFRVQKSTGKVLALIFWDEDIIIFQRANYQRGILLISAGANEGHFEGKTPREDHQGGLVLAQCPAHQALATQKKGFQCLDHPPYSLDLTSSDYHLFPGLKKQLKGHHFSSNVVDNAAAETWLDGQPSEFF